MSTVYLLSCSCGQQLEVDAGQAGAELTCVCGKKVVVPTVRGLKQLPLKAGQAEHRQAAVPGWPVWKGAVFSLGLLLAVAALLFTAWNARMFWMTRRLADPEALAIANEWAQIDSLTPEDTLQFFRQEANQGLGEQSPTYWAAIDEAHENARQWMVLGVMVAGIGLLAAAMPLMLPSARR